MKLSFHHIKFPFNLKVKWLYPFFSVTVSIEISDFDRRKDKENNDGMPLKRESEKNLSNYDAGYDYYEYDYESDDARIVSGYNPLERPWMALIIVKPSVNSSFLCAGSLLNHL